jgi:DNA-binding CsgD family transcriptional regulator
MAKSEFSDEQHALPSLSLVFGYIAVKELQRLEDRVRVLARLGYGNAEIAKICNTTSAVVSTLKSAAKKKPERKSKRRKE